MMLADGVIIRAAAPGDIAAIAAIYAHHVTHGLASFELDPPPADEMLRRYRDLTDRGYPYLVAERGGHVAGYAYAGAYRPRRAYRYSVENSVYVDPEVHRSGVGRVLLLALIAECGRLGFRQMIAVIGDSANAASIGLHASCGFERIGILPAVGFKFGRWVDSVFMQCAIGGGGDELPSQEPRLR